MIKRPVTFTITDAVGGIIADLYDADNQSFCTMRHIGPEPGVFKSEVVALVEFLNSKESEG